MLLKISLNGVLFELNGAQYMTNNRIFTYLAELMEYTFAVYKCSMFLGKILSITITLNAPNNQASADKSAKYLLSTAVVSDFLRIKSTNSSRLAWSTKTIQYR